jgi:hypothetical protein
VRTTSVCGLRRAYQRTNITTDTFPSLSGTSSWQYVRRSDNWQSNGPVTDVSSKQVRCYQNSLAGSSTQTVSAGSTVTFTVAPDIFHPGPLLFYMAQAPSGQSLSSWDPTDAVWFKIYQQGGTWSNGQFSWPSLSASVQLNDLSMRVNNMQTRPRSA